MIFFFRLPFLRYSHKRRQWKQWFQTIRKLPFVPSSSSPHRASRVTSKFYADLCLEVPEVSSGKASSEIDLARASALASYEQDFNSQTRPRTSSASEGSTTRTGGMHSRSKSTGGSVDDFGFAVDPRTPSSIKSNSFPRATPPVLKKGRIKKKKIVSAPSSGLVVPGASPSLRGVAPIAFLFSRLEHTGMEVTVCLVSVLAPEQKPSAFNFILHFVHILSLSIKFCC
jgi:hypothetical protein